MQKITRNQRLLLALALGISCLTQPAFSTISVAGSQAEAITIKTSAPAKPFPHFWEHMFGGCRANLSLRESYRDDLRKTKSIVDMQYVREHGIFMDDNGVYDEDKEGKPIYNWTYVDQIYDGYLNNGIRPLVELGFMPSKLAAKQSIFGFWYKPNVSPPKDYDKWSALLTAFADHLIQRYGIDEVSKWYFEVWNEPNIDFWAGEPKEATYYKLYDVSARAIKKSNARLRVGGPSTAQAAWVDRFIDYCDKNKVPVDFVSTHVYANDTADNVFGTEERIPRKDMVSRAMRKVYDQVKASKMPNIPIIWSEYNASYMNEQNVTDAAFMGPWFANLISKADGLVNEISYWTFSDVFEEGGIAKTPFYGGFGLIAPGGIPKTAFNAFKILHFLGDQRIPLEADNALATKRKDGTIVVAVWNYAGPDDAGQHKTVNLKFDGLTGANSTDVQVYTIDRDHGCSLTAFKAMGSPSFPTREQQKLLREAGTVPPPAMRRIENGNLKMELDPFALSVVVVPASSPK